MNDLVKISFDPRSMSPKSEWSGPYIESFNLVSELREALEGYAESLHCHTHCYAMVKPEDQHHFDEWLVK